MAKLVSSKHDIKKNIYSLAKLSNAAESERKFHAKLIKNGKLFVALKSQGRWLFAPSRFAGYENNGPNHVRIRSRDGRITNRRISELIGPYLDRGDPTYAVIDREFLKTCKRLNIAPSRHHRPRRYWLIDHRSAGKGVSSLGYERSGQDIEADIETLFNRKDLQPTQRKTLILARLGQGQFRRKLIAYWKACAVTGCKLRAVLRASHIKPWKRSNDREKVDSANGLLLLATLDALFDKGLISFKASGSMLVSSKVGLSVQKDLALGGNLSKKLTTRQLKYLQVHRSRIFIR